MNMQIIVLACLIEGQRRQWVVLFRNKGGKSRGTWLKSSGCNPQSTGRHLQALHTHHILQFWLLLCGHNGGRCCMGWAVLWPDRLNATCSTDECPMYSHVCMVVRLTIASLPMMDCPSFQDQRIAGAVSLCGGSVHSVWVVRPRFRSD
jgi:hypothetical protein